jgi:hypothetical protein
MVAAMARDRGRELGLVMLGDDAVHYALEGGTASSGIFPRRNKSRYFDALGRLKCMQFACYRPLQCMHLSNSTRRGLGKGARLEKFKMEATRLKLQIQSSEALLSLMPLAWPPRKFAS